MLFEQKSMWKSNVEISFYSYNRLTRLHFFIKFFLLDFVSNKYNS